MGANKTLWNFAAVLLDIFSIWLVIIFRGSGEFLCRESIDKLFFSLGLYLLHYIVQDLINKQALVGFMDDNGLATIVKFA